MGRVAYGIIPLLLALLANSDFARAQNYHTIDRPWRDAVGGWKVGWNEIRQGCLAIGKTRNGTALFMGLGAGGDIRFFAAANQTFGKFKSGQTEQPPLNGPI
jgi:hypothetical protein